MKAAAAAQNNVSAATLPAKMHPWKIRTGKKNEVSYDKATGCKKSCMQSGNKVSSIAQSHNLQ
jgi:hypothetical protein